MPNDLIGQLLEERRHTSMRISAVESKADKALHLIETTQNEVESTSEKLKDVHSDVKSLLAFQAGRTAIEQSSENLIKRIGITTPIAVAIASLIAWAIKSYAH